MKSKCSFILKSGIALILCFLMLFGTVTSSLAAVISDSYDAAHGLADTGAEEKDIADTGADVEIVDEGADVDIAGSGFDIYDYSGSRKIYYYYNDTYSDFRNKSGFAHLYLVIGHSSWYERWEMTQVTNSALFRLAETSATSNWSGASYMFILATNNTWSGNKSEGVSGGSATIKGWGGVIGSTADYNPGNISTGSSSGQTIYLKTSAGATTTLTHNAIGSANGDKYDTLKGGTGYVTYKTQLANAGSSSYSNSTTSGIAKIKLKTGYWASATSVTLSEAESSTGSTSYDSPALAAKSTLSYSEMGSSYEFRGFYQGTSSSGGTMTTLATSGTSVTVYPQTYTGTAQQYQYYFARFQKKPKLTISQTGATGTVSIGGSAQTSAYLSTSTDTNVSISAPAGYTISSVTGTGWTRTAGETSTTTYTGKANISADQTFTVTYAEIKDSAVALTAYTNGEASTTGGKIQVGGVDKTSIPAGDIGVATSVTAVSVVTSGGDYAFTGWQFDGSNYDHIKYSFNNSTWTTPAAQNTTYGTSSNTTIYIKTDGTSGLTTADAIVKAMFVSNRRTVTTAALLATDSTGYKSTNSFTTNPTLTGAGTYNSVSDAGSVSLVANEPEGYRFIGWYVSSSDSVGSSTPLALNTAIQGTSGIYTYNAGTKTLSFTMNTTCDLHYYALYKKIYYITTYNTYDEPEPNEFRFRTSPPRTVTATNAQGTTTFTYSTTDVRADCGEDDFGNGDGYAKTAELTPPTVTKNIKTSGTFYEGNLLAVLAGDSVTMTYSTLSSSDAISGVFFNNDIRYTTELEYDNLYHNRVYKGYHDVVKNGETVTVGYGDDDDWGYTYEKATTLFADASYYRSEVVEGTDPEVLVKDRINTVTSNGTSPYIATVNQDAHTVTWTVNQDYKNIDIELANKRQIVFSDTTNTKINSLSTDNYYSVGENVSTGSSAATRLAVYAKGNDQQKTTITLANVKFYYYSAKNGWFTDASGNKLADQSSPVELTGTDASITKAISTGTSITNDYSASDSSAYIYFGGTMPNTDVYVDLAVNVVYKMYIGSQIVSDTIASKTYLAQVATITATYTSPSSDNHSAGTSALYNSTYKECTAESKVKYTLEWGTDTGSSKTWDNYYMFNGWYTGTSAGPDYDKGYLGNDVTLYYTPKKNTYVYAVGTRDVFINGSAEIIGKNQDWNAGDSNKNLRMNFDPDYVNTDGGARGRYYWTITDSMLTAASGKLANGPNNAESKISYADWESYTSGATVNSFFRLYDTETASPTDTQNNLTLWQGVDKFTNGNVSENGVDFGKTIPTSNNSDSGWEKRAGYGWIAYDSSDSRYQGWSSPITIYYYPGKGISVSATPVWPHIYVSNGYKGIDTANNGTPSTVSVTVDGANTLVETVTGSGTHQWTSLTYEGTVKEYKIKKKNADVKLTKTVADGYKVSYFFVYNLATEKVNAVAATAESTENTYSATVKMNNDESMYICPIVESTSADMTVMFDASQLNYDEWGKFVSCYAWYSNDATSGAKKAYGPYPGQLMIPYDGGLSWQANFPSKNGDATLVGITFANYVDGTNTWLGGTDVMGTVTENKASGSGTAQLPRTETASGGLITVYNAMTGTDDGKGNYDKTNFKAQTYDYREPIAFNNNSDADQKLITFAVKDGNSELISWTYNDLKTANAKSHIGASSWPLSFEYLVDQKGKYVDLNGVSLNDKPTPSFYVCAKGMVTYSNNEMLRQFVGGNTADGTYTSNSVKYEDAYDAESGVAMNYAVQWYIYDASGKYVDTVLSAGYADKSADDVGDTSGMEPEDKQDAINKARTQVAAKLENAGYAVSGRSVAICYDVPRYCYNTATYANGGTNFDAYRFTGQWLQQNQYETAQVSVEVGLRYAGDVTMSDSSSTDYGSANVTVDKSILTHKSYAETGVDEKTGLNYGKLTIVEGNRKALTITADDINFEGWYYYNNDGELTLASQNPSYTPGVSKDITYYAIYKASATYKLNYTGREGGVKSYSVSGGDMTADEIGNNNTVSTSRTDFDTKFGGASISIFKKTVNLSTHSALNNSTARTLQANLTGITDATFTLTYYYPDSSGAAATAHTAGTTDIPYNSLVDLSEYTAAITAGAPSGKVFKGWYEYDASGSETGSLLSTASLFGQRIVKNTTIIAVYDDAPYSNSGTNWNVYIDDQEVTKEMTSTTNGTYYNDAIIRLRYDGSVNQSIPEGAEAGILVIRDDGSGAVTTRSVDDLTKYAKSTSLTNGKTAKIKDSVLKVTKVCVNDPKDLTSYNRSDFSVRSDYAGTNGQNYSIYAYIKIGDSCTFSTVKSGTYR